MFIYIYNLIFESLTADSFSDYILNETNINNYVNIFLFLIKIIKKFLINKGIQY